MQQYLPGAVCNVQSSVCGGEDVSTFPCDAENTSYYASHLGSKSARPNIVKYMMTCTKPNEHLFSLPSQGPFHLYTSVR